MAPKIAAKTKKTETKVQQPAPDSPAASNGAAEKPTKKRKAKDTREVIYDTVGVQLCIGDNSLTADLAKQYLGWYESDDKAMFRDGYGKKIACSNNTKNRPLDFALAKTYASEVLNKRWKLNGETVIVGKYGGILSAQHRLIGLVLAHQEWEQNKADWKHLWRTAPTMPTLLVTGIEEDDATVNSIDNVKPRTLADILYRSDYFASLKPSDRNACSRIAAYAIRFVCHRTGAWRDAYAPKRTHSEFLDFLSRHDKILDCVKHIWEEDGTGKEGGKLSKSLKYSVGTAAGLLYLMACSTSDPVKYREGDPTSQADLDFTLLDKSMDFWVILASGGEELAGVREAIRNLYSDDEDESSRVAEKTAIIAKAWNLFSSGAAITPRQLELSYKEDEDGNKSLSECPTVGGIDLGNPEDDEEADTVETEPSEDEADEPAAEEANEDVEQTDDTPHEFAEGDVVTVSDANSGHDWTGEYLHTCPTKGKQPPTAMIRDEEGGEYEVYLSWISPAE